MIVRLGPAAEAELEEAPRSFTPAGPERRYRRALVGRFPYQLIFELANDEVRVLAVAHLRRQPGYWTGRT